MLVYVFVSITVALISHLSSCEASLTAMKICLDTIMRSCIEGVDSRVLFVDPKVKTPDIAFARRRLGKTLSRNY